MATIPSYMGFELGAQPGGGSDAYGYQVGQVGAPPSIWQQLQQNIPGLTNTIGTATNDILSELNGTLSPSTQSNIGNYAAARGVALGQPNSPLSNLIGMNITGTTTEGLQNEGIGNLNSLLNTTGQMQESPQLLSTIAEQNAVNAAAPNPQSASDALLAQYQKMMNPATGRSTFTATGPAGAGGFSTGFGSDAQLGQNFNQFQMFNPFQTGIGSTWDINGGADMYNPVNYAGDGGGY